MSLQVLRLHPDAVLPSRRDGSVGLDLFARLPFHVTIPPGESLRIGTGTAVAIPYGYEGQIRSRPLRPGPAFDGGLIALSEAVGSDFRGEVTALVVNRGKVNLRIYPKECIAQLFIQKVEVWDPEEVTNLPSSHLPKLVKSQS